MSWRWLFVLVVCLLGAGAAGGLALGDWLVEKAPSVSADPRTNTARPPEVVLDAAGRPLAAVAPQPLIDGRLGVPEAQAQPMWQLEAVSLFETNLDPMVVLGRGDQSYSVSDMLSQAGSGLVQGPSDVAMLDVTAGVAPAPATAEPARKKAADKSWQSQLAEAIAACDKVGFFSRPGCVESARQKFCEPNRGWGRDPMCPAQSVNVAN